MRPTAGGPGVYETDAKGLKLAANGLPPATLPEPTKRAREQDLAGSLARAMWLSGASAMRAKRNPRATRIQRPERGWAC